jgi:hypothetical protein
MKIKSLMVLLTALLLVMPGVFAEVYSTAGDVLFSDYMEEDSSDQAGKWEVKVKEVETSLNRCKIRVDDSEYDDEFWLNVNEKKVIDESIIVKVNGIMSGMCNVVVNEFEHYNNAYLVVVTHDGRAIDTLTSIDVINYIDGYDPKSEILNLLDNEVKMQKMREASLTVFILEDRALIILGENADKDEIELAEEIAELLEANKRQPNGIDSRIINVGNIKTDDLRDILNNYWDSYPDVESWADEAYEYDFCGDGRCQTYEYAHTCPSDCNNEYAIGDSLMEGENKIYGMACGEFLISLILIEDLDEPTASFEINGEVTWPMTRASNVYDYNDQFSLRLNEIELSDVQYDSTKKNDIADILLVCLGADGHKTSGSGGKGVAYDTEEEMTMPAIGVDVKTSPAKDSCSNGCFVNSDMNKCLPFGTRVTLEEMPKYCDIDGDLKDQKKDGSAAENDYECESNSARYGECENVAEQTGFITKMFGWFSKIFG